MIDPRAAWFAPWCERLGARFNELLASTQTDDLASRLNALGSPATTLSGHAVRFVEHARLPADTAYETHIHATGHVPTRDNTHDLFNALAWFVFPRAKTALNAIQAREIARRGGTAGPRGPARDAATLLDENGLLLVTRDNALIDHLRARRWTHVFVERRAQWMEQVRVLMFGHALADKLRAPYKSITAHAWVVSLDCHATFDAIDEHLAHEWLGHTTLAPSMLLPVPVLGLPGWWPLNQSREFYDDASVFRAARV
ncbi:MAG TPA: DUF3025 domain-containing protein [Burkholderiaceae bacterium]|nr:DUF3025 domain-containing protein [Burkholderiaceae bacterium]